MVSAEASETCHVVSAAEGNGCSRICACDSPTSHDAPTLRVSEMAIALLTPALGDFSAPTVARMARSVPAMSGLSLRARTLPLLI